jgi:hypothetical protein
MRNGSGQGLCLKRRSRDRHKRLEGRADARDPPALYFLDKKYSRGHAIQVKYSDAAGRVHEQRRYDVAQAGSQFLGRITKPSSTRHRT